MWLLILLLRVRFLCLLLGRLLVLLNLVVRVPDETLCQSSDELRCGRVLLLFDFIASSQISDWFDLVVLLLRRVRSWVLLSLVLGSDQLLGAYLVLLLLRSIRLLLLARWVLSFGEEVVPADRVLDIWVRLGLHERRLIVNQDDLLNLDCLYDLRLYSYVCLGVF